LYLRNQAGSTARRRYELVKGRPWGSRAQEGLFGIHPDLHLHRGAVMSALDQRTAHARAASGIDPSDAIGRGARIASRQRRTPALGPLRPDPVA
jgi:hypothetical protein